MAAPGRTRLDHDDIREREARQGECSFLQRMGSLAPARCDPVDLVLLLRAYRKLWYCLLAADYPEAHIRIERYESDLTGRSALRGRLHHPAVEWLALRQNRGAPLACGASRH